MQETFQPKNRYSTSIAKRVRMQDSKCMFWKVWFIFKFDGANFLTQQYRSNQQEAKSLTPMAQPFSRSILHIEPYITVPFARPRVRQLPLRTKYIPGTS